MKQRRLIAFILALFISISSTFVNVNSSIVRAEELETDIEKETADDMSTEEKEKHVTEVVDSNVENTSDIYIGDGYTVEFKLDNKWDSGYNATVTISNLSDEIIENWKLIIPLDNTITNIWNAQIDEDYEDYYAIKNAGWNQDIPVGGSASFGITSYEMFVDFPEYYITVGGKVETEYDDYSVEYLTTDIWEDGLIGKIKITNLREKPIEDWRLCFNYEGEIEEIWDGKILTHSNNQYVIAGEDYNQNIKESVSIGFKVSIDDMIGNPENFKISEYNSSYHDSSIYAMGELDDINSNVVLYYASTEKLDNYYIYISQNGKDYELYKETDSIETLEINYAEGEMYFYVEGEKYGKKFSSDIVSISKEDNLPKITNPDTDKEGLCDYLEFAYGTDINEKDTDRDGLNDYYEVIYTCTNPLEYDTDKDGISDADEDLDGDGLSNINEYNFNTYPFDIDTDGDGLSDYDEIYIYGTDPLVADSDGDELEDGDEIELGFDPLIQDTDKDGILDSDEYVLQHAEYEINEAEKPLFTKVSVDVSCKGNLSDNVKFENMYNCDVHSSNVVGLLSVPMEIKVNADFDNAVINFKYDESQLGNIKEENLAMLWYDVENDNYVLLDSVVDKETNTVSYKTTHFSLYLIVDKTIWMDCWREDINYRKGSSAKYYDIIFTVDVSGSMQGERIKVAKQAMKSFMDGFMIEDNVGLVSFASNAKILLNLTGYYYNGTAEILNEEIDRLSAGGGTDCDAGLRFAIKAFTVYQHNIAHDNGHDKVIILLCDGNVSVSEMTVAEAIENGITINCINVTSGSAEIMKEIAYATGGSYYYAATTEDLIKQMEKIQEETIDSIDITDTDGDGLYDVYEVNGMKLSNGQVVYADPNNMDTDGDGISDYDELGGVPEGKKVYFGSDIYSCTIFHNRSNPGMTDSDDDGIPDIVDTNPNIADVITVAELERNDYIDVESDDGSIKYGGDQSFWDNTNELISDFGCGLIACTDVELYLTLYDSRYDLNKSSIEFESPDVIEHSYYVERVEENGKGRYKINDRPLKVLDQVDPSTMESGLEVFYKENGYDYSVTWAGTNNSWSVNKKVIDNIDNNMPVIMAYFSFTKRLPFYTNCDKSEGAKKSCKSHYVVITGVYKKYDATDNTYDTYYSISSWGEKYYIFADDFLDNLSYFSNILATEKY